MANFDMHLNTAAIISGALSISFVGLHLIDIKTSFYCFIAGVIGGILPDIDHNYSIPIKLLKFILSNLVAFLVIITYFNKLKFLELIGVWIGVLVLFEGIFFLFKKFTTHRGIIHSVPMGVLFALLSILFLNKVLGFSIIKAYFVGLFLFIGYVIHLFLDEIYSIDISGRRLKNSFGSAFKFFSHNKIVDIFIYSLIILFFMFLPDKEKFIHLIKDLFNV